MLNITDLHKSFGDKQVLQGLTLNVPEHSLFGFIGQNGAGKTTTMKTVLGLLKPDQGTVTVAGEPVVFGQTATNRLIGYLPDVPEFYGFMTAGEYLQFCGDITGIPGKQLKSRISELLKAVGLEGEGHKIKGFSRGMKQRLGIAQALLGRPRLLICDEPTSALDPVGRREILDILQSVRQETTVLFSTHILSDVERICTDVALLHQGTVQIQGPLDQIKAQYRREAYLIETEQPRQAQQLATSLKGCNFENGQLFFTEREESLFDLLSFVTRNRIGLTKLERQEPSLEKLFLEVVGK